MSWFDWKYSLLGEDQTARVEQLSITYHSIFATHSLYTGIDLENIVKLTPQHNKRG